MDRCVLRRPGPGLRAPHQSWSPPDMTWARRQQVPGLPLGVIPRQGLACRRLRRRRGRWWPAGPRAPSHLELHMLVLLEAAEAVAVNFGVVHEDVRSVAAGNEAVALLGVSTI